MKNDIHNKRIIKIRLVLLLYLICLFIPSCGKPVSNSDYSADSIGKKFEYSYITPKGKVIANDDGDHTEYISLGIPPKNNTAHHSNNFLIKYNNKIVFTNNIGVNCYDGMNTEEFIKCNESPCIFDISDHEFVYVNELDHNIYIRNLDDKAGSKEKSIGSVHMFRFENDWCQDNDSWGGQEILPSNELLVVQNHIFYKSPDGKLCRMTINGHENTVLTDMEVDNINYRNGYVYFINDSYLYRISTNGKELSKAMEQGVSDTDYWLSDYGIIFNSDSNYFYKKYDSNSDLQLGCFDGDGNFEYEYIGTNNDFVYFYKISLSDSVSSKIVKFALTQNTNKEIVVVDNMNCNISLVTYPPVIQDDTIYFYTDSLYKVKTDGTDMVKIGPAAGYFPFPLQPYK